MSARDGGEGDRALNLLELHHHGSEIPRDAPNVGQTWRPEGDVSVGGEHEVVVAGSEVARDVVVEGFGSSQIACSLSGGHEQGARDASIDVIVVGGVLITIGVAVDLLLLV